LNPRLQIVYISHNVESEIKYLIGNLEKWPRAASADYVSKVTQSEDKMIQIANTTFCCSEEDRMKLINRGSSKCFVIPNGGQLHPAKSMTAIELQKFLGCDKFVLFVASGHPPNFYGFLSGIGEDFGFLKDGQRLVVVGSAGKYLEAQILKSQFKETFLKRGSILHFAEEKLLGSLYANAHATILPIFEGGGTNIKTAEAFLNSNFVITTEFALRGFDTRLYAESAYQIVSDKRSFKEAILETLMTDQKPQRKINKNYYSWEWVTQAYQILIEQELRKLGLIE
jgi:hypothetical protein